MQTPPYSGPGTWPKEDEDRNAYGYNPSEEPNRSPLSLPTNTLINFIPRGRCDVVRRQLRDAHFAAPGYRVLPTVNGT